MTKLTEEQIERRVERETDKWDALLMSGAITQEEYDRITKSLAAWAARQS